MKVFNKISLAGFALAALACGDGSTSNPATADRNELYAPSKLITLTQDGKIQLRWSASNAEEDFKGYLVFGATQTVDSLKDNVAFPEGAKSMLDTFGIPRCLENTKFFEAFGLDPVEKECDADEDPKASETKEEGFGLLAKASKENTGGTDSDANEEEEEKEVLKNMIPCAELKDATLKEKVSLDVAPPATTMQTCTVAQVYDATAKKLVDISNGVPMTFVVFAVMGDDYDTISWSSNVVEDASSKTVAGFDGTAIDLALKEYVKISFAVTDDDVTATASAAAACPADSFCKVLGANNESNAEPAIYLSRDNKSSTYTQRIFVSIPKQDANSAIEIQARGAQTSWEGGKFGARIPGDEPAATYDDSGVTFLVTGNQVFDFKLASGSGYKYGKIVFEPITYAGDKSTVATIKTTIIVQTGTDVKHYLW